MFLSLVGFTWLHLFWRELLNIEGIDCRYVCLPYNYCSLYFFHFKLNNFALPEIMMLLTKSIVRPCYEQFIVGNFFFPSHYREGCHG